MSGNNLPPTQRGFGHGKRRGRSRISTTESNSVASPNANHRIPPFGRGTAPRNQIRPVLPSVGHGIRPISSCGRGMRTVSSVCPEMPYMPGGNIRPPPPCGPGIGFRFPMMLPEEYRMYPPPGQLAANVGTNVPAIYGRGRGGVGLANVIPRPPLPRANRPMPYGMAPIPFGSRNAHGQNGVVTGTIQPRVASGLRPQIRYQPPEGELRVVYVFPPGFDADQLNSPFNPFRGDPPQ